MKPPPIAPLELQARTIDALCADLSDHAGFKTRGFVRTESLRRTVGALAGDGGQ